MKLNKKHRKELKRKAKKKSDEKQKRYLYQVLKEKSLEHGIDTTPRDLKLKAFDVFQRLKATKTAEQTKVKKEKDVKKVVDNLRKAKDVRPRKKG